MVESGLFKTETFKNKIDYSNERWTVDETKDLEVIRNIVKHFYPKIHLNGLML